MFRLFLHGDTLPHIYFLWASNCTFDFHYWSHVVFYHNFIIHVFVNIVARVLGSSIQHFVSLISQVSSYFTSLYFLSLYYKWTTNFCINWFPCPLITVEWPIMLWVKVISIIWSHSRRSYYYKSTESLSGCWIYISSNTQT